MQFCLITTGLAICGGLQEHDVFKLCIGCPVSVVAALKSLLLCLWKLHMLSALALIVFR